MLAPLPCSQLKERLQSQCGIAQPAVAVVPVQLPTGGRGKGGTGRTDEGSRRTEGEQLDRQSRPDHLLAPTPAVGALIDPASPEVKRAAVRFFGTVFPWREEVGAAGRMAAVAKEQPALGAVRYRKFRYHRLVCPSQGNVRCQRDRCAASADDGSPLGKLCLGPHSPIIGSRITHDAKGDLSPESAESPVELGVVGPFADACFRVGWHEVHQIRPSRIRHESRHQDVGERLIRLFARKEDRRSDLEAPPLVRV